MEIVHGYFSPNGETKKIAQLFYNELGGSFIDLTLPQSRVDHRKLKADLYILSLPVYAQNIPKPLRKFLVHIKAPQVFINLTYGGFSYGNVLHRIKKRLLVSNIVGYTVTPVKHSLIDQKIDIYNKAYESVLLKLKTQNYHKIRIPYRFHNIFTSIFERSRTRYNYRLLVNKDLCDQCNLCINECPSGSITSSIKILDSCISCNHCVQVCPKHAITSKKSKFIDSYLKRKQKTSVVVR